MPPSAAAQRTTTQSLGASVQAVIDASPEALWRWIGDPTRHPTLAGSGEPQSIRVIGEAPLGVGSEFESQQAMLKIIRYTVRSVVVAYEPERRLHFLVGGRSDWAFELDPVAGGTRVTHRFRVRPPAGPIPALTRTLLKPRVRANARGMKRTLENLATLVGAPQPASIQVSHLTPAFD